MGIGVLVSSNTDLGVIQAVLIGVSNLERIGLKITAPSKSFDNQTIEEWAKNVFGRIKEHCFANGYYKPDSPSDLIQLKERGKKVIKILLDEREFLKYIPYSDSEEREVLINTAIFFRELKKFVSPIMFEEDGDILPNLSCLYEDLIGKVEKLISKKEQAEKNNKPFAPTSNSPNSSSTKPSAEYKNNLETEIKRLQDQVSELETKVNGSKTDTTQKETYQKILDNVKKLLGDKQKERDKLGQGKPEKPTSSDEKSNNKLNWAIGLGIGAVVIGLFCLILIASRRKE